MKYFLVFVVFISVIYNTYMQAYWFIPKLLGFLFYFVLGMYIRDNYELIDIQKIARKYWLLIAAVAFIGTVYGTINVENTTFSTSILPNLMSIHLLRYFEEMLYITTLIFLVFYISNILYNSKKANLISFIGSYSFGVYLIHAYFVVMVEINLHRFGIKLDNTLFYPCVLIFSLIISLATVIIIKQLPYHEYIIGKTSSDKSSDMKMKSIKSGTSPQK